MPQVDLETLVSACAGGGSSMDRKIACETQACDGENPPETTSASAEEVPSDFPPESFWLSKDAEHDWFDRNAFFERKESQKGNNSNSTNLNPNIVPGSHSNSNSQRFSMNIKSKAAIIGLPKGQKSYAVEAKHRKNSTARLFPKKKNGLSATAMAEPSSPKVSCMGRVRSKKDRNRRSRKKLPESPPETADKRRTGFFATFRSIFRTGCREKPSIASSRYTAVAESERSEDSPSERGSHAHPRRSVDIEPPGLGGLNRFASGRRSAALIDDVA